MNRGEILILRSDGAEDGKLLQLPEEKCSAGELAAWLLESSSAGRDDATVAVVQLLPAR